MIDSADSVELVRCLVEMAHRCAFYNKRAVLDRCLNSLTQGIVRISDIDFHIGASLRCGANHGVVGRLQALAFG